MATKDTPTLEDAPAATCIEGDGGVVYGDSPIITEEVRQAGDPPSLVSPPGAEPIELPDDVTPQTDPETFEEEEASYQANTVVELKDELAARGLSTSGSKDELVARLEADDATNG